MPDWLIAFEPGPAFMGFAVFVIGPVVATLYAWTAIRFIRGRNLSVARAAFLAGPPGAVAGSLLLDRDLSLPFFFFMALTALAVLGVAFVHRSGPVWRRVVPALLPSVLVVLWYFVWIALEASKAV